MGSGGPTRPIGSHRWCLRDRRGGDSAHRRRRRRIDQPGGEKPQPKPHRGRMADEAQTRTMDADDRDGGYRGRALWHQPRGPG